MLRVSMVISVIGSLVTGFILMVATDKPIYLGGGIVLMLGFVFLFAKLINRADAQVRAFFAEMGIADKLETRGKKNWKVRNVLQPNVDAILKTIAMNLDAVCKEEEEKRTRYSTQSCDVRAVEKVRDLYSLTEKIREIKETFWKLYKTAGKLGFKVEKSHKDYLSTGHMA